MKRLSLWVLASVVLALAAPPLSAENGVNPGRGTRVVKRSSPGETGTPRYERKATAVVLLRPGEHRDPRPGHVLLQDGHRHHQQHQRQRRRRDAPVLLQRRRRLPGLLASRGSPPARPRQLPHGRHGPVPRLDRRDPAGCGSVLVRHSPRDLRQPSRPTSAGRARSRRGRTARTTRPTRRSAPSRSRTPARSSSSPPTQTLVGTIRDTQRPRRPNAGAPAHQPRHHEHGPERLVARVSVAALVLRRHPGTGRPTVRRSATASTSTASRPAKCVRSTTSSTPRTSRPASTR